MDIRGLVWVGTATERYGETVAFFRDVLGLAPFHESEGLSILRVPSGEWVEVFGPSHHHFAEFNTGPVVEFLVDDVPAARAELAGRGIRWIPLRYHKRPSLPATLFDVLAGVARGIAVVRSRRIGAVHARSYVAGLMGWLLKRILGVRFVFDMRGRFQRTFGEQDLQRPTGLALDERSGRLFVTDTLVHRIVVFDAAGKVEKSFGARGTGQGELNYPAHLWLDPSGRLFVVDSLNYRIQIFQPDGRFEGEFGRQGDGSGDFASPKGVAADSRGHLYVVDALFDAVQIFDRHGEFLFTFGERGIGPSQFWLPSGLCIDERDRIYVADSHNHRIQIFEFVGGPDGR